MYVLGHDLVGATHLAVMFALAHHLLDALDDAVAVVEPLGDGLRELLYLTFLVPLSLVVVKPRQYVLLMQPLQLLALAGDVGQQLRHFVRRIRPPRRKQVHLDHRIAVVDIVGPRG